jgi:3-oxo-5-alpha-steroid 4-dehydrogenase 1
MNEKEVFPWLLTAWFALGAAFFIVLFLIIVPYGRHLRRGWGPGLNKKLAWLLMESVAATGFLLFFILGENKNVVSWIFLLMWEAHYIHRAFIYPFQLRGVMRTMPLAVMASGIIFNSVNAYLNGRYLFSFSEGYSISWLQDPRFITGLLLFTGGYLLNRQSDNALRLLKAKTPAGYGVPQGGLYRWVSCPNYLGEIMIWTGWAIATWSLPGLVFAFWTCANLIPRAHANHVWYKQQFTDYPSHRKALLPGIW